MQVRDNLARSSILIEELRNGIERGDVATLRRVASALEESLSITESVVNDLISETALIRVLASVGTQLAAFIHELNGLVATAQHLDAAISDLRTKGNGKIQRVQLSRLNRATRDLRHALELQASYLVDVLSVDARRRRSRQAIRRQFSASMQLIAREAQRQNISISNDIPSSLRTPPMFPAELIAVFANLLTNAVKAAGVDGLVRASAHEVPGDGLYIQIQNTGARVAADEGEKWFRPFESTTSTIDPILGQGMGMGLPITRSMLEEYGATIQFVDPTGDFATAIQIKFPY
jgi:signal transduction histidine kinase